MKLRSLGAKLFLSQTLAMVVLAIALVAIFWVSLGSGFKHYISTIELSRLDLFDRHLVVSYRKTGSWDFIRSPRDLIPAKTRRGPPGRYGRPPPLGKHDNPLSLRRRLALFGADGIFLMGRPEAKGQAQRKLFDGEGQLIGFLALAPMAELDDAVDKEFIAHQARNLAISCLLAIAASALFSAWLANYFKRPINALAAASRHLGEGELGTRVHMDRDDELGSLANDFNHMAQKFEDFEHGRRQWVADTSHELRTPITILRVQVDAMRDGIIPLEHKSLANLESAIGDLDRLATDLYQLARFDIGAYEHQLVDINLVELIDDIEAQFRQSLLKAQIRFSKNLLPTLTLYADYTLIHQLFSNLFSNSIRYSNPHGEIVLNATQNDHFSDITFDDRPPGVPNSALPHLFERFYRVEGSHNKHTGGSGLGLAICKSIVKGMGGDISAHHSPLGGLRIHIQLPLPEDKTS